MGIITQAALIVMRIDLRQNISIVNNTQNEQKNEKYDTVSPEFLDV